MAENGDLAIARQPFRQAHEVPTSDQADDRQLLTWYPQCDHLLAVLVVRRKEVGKFFRDEESFSPLAGW